MTPANTGPTGSKRPETIRVAAAERGHRLHNLWIVYSQKLKTTLILPSDAAMFHVVILETDRMVASYQLEAPAFAVMVDGIVVGTRFDATVTFIDASKAWDEVKHDISPEDARKTPQVRAQIQLAAGHDCKYRLFTLGDFVIHTNRIWNGIRMLTTLQRAKNLSLANARTAIAAKLLGGPATQGELRVLDVGDQGINLAALYALYIEGAVDADISRGPITDLTTFSMRKETSHA